MSCRRIASQFEVRALTDSGQISGYGSVWNIVDWYGTNFAKGAFSESLSKRRPLMLWQHNPKDPCGVWTSAREDDKGLYVEGQLALKTQRGAEAYELLKMGALDGLSVGFETVKYQVDDKTETYTILQADLWEVSPVSFPANEAARVDAVRSRIAGDRPTIRDLEMTLRDAGLSRKEAKVLLSQGFKALELQDAADDGASAVREVAEQFIRSIKGV